MRVDGRQPDQARALNIRPDFMSSAEGSALIETGNTKIICTASVEESVPNFLRGSGRGWVTAEYDMLPRSTSTRKPREARLGRPSGRTSEIQRLIGRSLRAAVNMGRLGERTLFIDCDVMQADGGTRTAAITGGWVAMASAMQLLIEERVIRKMPIKNHVAAISVGIINGVPMLDLNYEEDSRADVDMNVVMNSVGDFVEIQASAEEQTFSKSQLNELLQLAQSGIHGLIAAQKNLIDIEFDA